MEYLGNLKEFLKDKFLFVILDLINVNSIMIFNLDTKELQDTQEFYNEHDYEDYNIKDICLIENRYIQIDVEEIKKD